MKRIVITIGGSNRQHGRHMQALENIEKHGQAAPIGLGSKRFHLIVTDTPELRHILATVKGLRVSSWQPSWLND